MLSKEEFKRYLKEDPYTWSEEKHKAMWEYHEAHPVSLTPEEIAERNKIIENIFKNILTNQNQRDIMYLESEESKMEGTQIIVVDKSTFVEDLFKKTVLRMGWGLEEKGDNWIITILDRDEELFNFVFGV